VTTHRKENTDHTIESICQGLLELTRRCREDLHLVFPVHLNPKVREPVHRYLGDVENVTLLDPVDYRTLLWLLQRCHFLLTDSGGLQEEAAGAGKPVLVLRQSTERPEGVRAGSARLIGSDPVHLVGEASKLLEDNREYERMSRATDPCPYGDGRAAARIAGILRAAVPSIGARAAP
jgi:UDP-N-acetylglucosamine 2-epimerase (non-hydrolysing)